jgi:hypothetical protein
MAVTAKFVTDRIDALPNVAAALTLRLYNDDAEPRQVTLSASGELQDHTKLDLTSANLETNQIVDVPVTVFLPSSVEAGTHTLTAEIQVAPNASEDADLTTSAGPSLLAATAAVDLAVHSDYTLALQPSQSRGSSSGRHVIRLANTGNVAVAVELAAHDVDDAITVQLGQTTLTVAPGAAGETSLRVTPATTFWGGASHDHEFVVDATSSEGRSEQLSGVYRQRPRVPNWLGPAAAGALAALIIGAIAWFAWLQPWVEQTSDQAAADAIELDRAALQERIDELETAAAEAEELPLGTPTDIRLDVDPAGGNNEQATTTAEPGTVLSITDVVLQNPTGAVGTVSWMRGDEVILQSELANFRDFDLHFVAPYQFDDTVEIVLEVDCRTPGAGQSTCPVGASLVGFVDEAD